MVTEDSSPMASGGEVETEKSVEGSTPNRKGQAKVPKKIHKAEREKLKRDQLNDLFSDLGSMLEPDRQNNGKATILGDTTRILRDLLTQVQTLRKENAALLRESHEVTSENSELRDEKNTLQAEIVELQNELRMRSISMHYGPTTNHALTHHHPIPMPHQHTPLPVMEPVYAAPPTPVELQLFPETATREEREREPSPPVPIPAHVSRPHARYARLADPWTGQLAVQEEQCNSGVTGSSREEGLDKI